MRYQVTITLSEPVTPPYGEWLELHIDEMLALKNEEGLPLFSSAEVEEEERQFWVVYLTTQSNFDYYEQTHADAMRSAFKQTYGDIISAFTFERSLIND